MSDEVLQAADNIVAAFSDGRLEDYFAAFTPDASFVFHTTPHRIGSVTEYRRVWAQWVADDGFRVLRCRSTDRMVQDWGDGAVFSHSVETDILTHTGTETLHERETIVFRRDDVGGWLAVHEHLSPAAPFTAVPAG
ncbi:nuclear transport factor 2 family protein [Streptomyces sp. NPDC005574]|uniref:nuclear transport factor 2 family protein n=1 Tax=Streptomyces sp. NPDC005574 TaxID=3156891 RepID=UPI0033A6CB0D